MAKYTQEDRWLTVTTSLRPDDLLLTGFRGAESVSELFEFHLDLVAENETKIPFERLIGQPITVESAVAGSPPRSFSGIIAELSQDRRDETFTYYSATMVPKAWRLTRTVQCRIFQQNTVPQILATVLADAGATFELTGQYLPHNFCVQYRESDFAFASRLMEEEGIHYYFRHSGTTHDMVVSDASIENPALPRQAMVKYDEESGGRRDECRIEAWRKTQRLRSSRVTIWDHHFQLPDKNLEAEKTVRDSVQVGAASHALNVGNDSMRLFDYPGSYAHRFDGIGPSGADRPSDVANVFTQNERTAGVRMEREAVESIEIEGAGNAGHFTAGFRFTLADHFDGSGDYVLTRVEHEAIAPVFRSGEKTRESVKVDYRNRFTCIPAELAYRPARKTPVPTVHGTQTATVVGPAGEEIFTDKFGRVKVQFNWDRGGKRDIGSSCWLRVAYGAAGGGFGHVHIPRVGHEVLVDFLEGDPDWPIVIAGVYNADKMPPFTLPDLRTQSAFKSHSRFGDGTNFSGIAMDDNKGAEHLQLHAERYMTHNTENTHYVNAGSQHHTHVGSFRVQQVGGLPGVDHARLVKPKSGSGSGGESAPDPRAITADVNSASADHPDFESSVTDAAGSYHAEPGSGSGGSSDGRGSPDGRGSSDGRGEGGGGEGGEGEGKETTTGVWDCKVKGAGGASIGITFGIESKAVIGLGNEVVIGSSYATVINPVSLLAKIPAVGSLLGAGVGSQGEAKIIVGSHTDLSCGPKFERSYGPTVELGVGEDPSDQASDAAKAMLPLIVTAGVAYSAMAVTNVFLGLANPKGAGQVLAGAGAIAQEMLLGLWLTFEAKLAATNASYTAEKGAALTTILGEQLAPEEAVASGKLTTIFSLIGVFYVGMPIVIICAASGAFSGGGDGEGDSGSGGSAGAEALETEAGTPKSVGCDGLYSIQAPGISIFSTPSVTSQANGVTIFAAGKDGVDGVVTAVGATSAHVAGGQASFLHLESPPDDAVTGMVTLSCGAEGALFLQSGAEKEPNFIALEPAGITTQSLIQVVTMAGEDVLIEMNPEEGITISAFVDNNILITEAGIEIIAGDSSISITAAGIEINGPIISITGDGDVSVEGAAVDIEAADISLNGAAVEIDSALVSIL